MCKTIIIVSHDMDEVAENCNKAAVFSGGEIVKCGNVKEIFSCGEELNELRLGLPLTAYIAEELKKSGVELNLVSYDEDGFVKAVKEYKNGIIRR